MMAPFARLALALLVGAGGGTLFFRLDLPLPWMLGAMVATTVAAFAGAPVSLPRPLRNGFVLVIGVMLGSAFTPEMLATMPGWGAGVAILALYVPVATILGYLFFRKVGGFSKVDAYFSAAPGGLNEMVMVGENYGGDVRRIAIVHTVRILIVVFLVPFYFRYVVDAYSPADRYPPSPALLRSNHATLSSSSALESPAGGSAERCVFPPIN